MSNGALQELSAKFTETPVVIDGKLDDAVWQDAVRYPLYLGMDKDSEMPQEGAEIMLAWDETHLYVGAKLVDYDIFQEGDDNQQHHYLTGDLLEVFLKPHNYEWYWELYATPNNLKTVFWFPSGEFLRHLRKTETFTHHLMEDLEVAAQVNGELNNREVKDAYWTVEMAIPASQLARFINPIDGDFYFGPGSKWRILVSRYNYSQHLAGDAGKELSMIPRLSRTRFHLTEEYGILNFTH